MSLSPSHITVKALDGRWSDEAGFTLIELMVSMVTMIVVTLASFSFLQFTTEDVAHITDRVHVDQAGRTALEKIMLQLHSACVSQEVNPIGASSNENVLSFVSASGIEPAFSVSEVSNHVITYTPASSKTEGTLIEQTFPSTGAANEGNYPFSPTASSTTKLLTGVRQTEVPNKETKVLEKTPIFRYYRYYQKAKDATPVYGELNPEPIKGELKSEAENVVKTTINFTLAPEGKEAVSFNHDRPVTLEDSAVFRLTPPSTAPEHVNSPCSETP